jgi:nucleoside phosphorylase
MLLVVFALPEEARVFQRRLGRKIRHGYFISGTIAGRQIGICFVGIRATGLADLDIAIEQAHPSLVINSGFAGATRTLLEPGDFVLAANYTTAGLAAPPSEVVDTIGKFVSADQVFGAAEKAAQHDSVIAVDMESAPIAAVCQRHQVPLVTARMISDRREESIPGIFIGVKPRNLADVVAGARFAVRMLYLTRVLADRLTRLIDYAPPEASGG